MYYTADGNLVIRSNVLNVIFRDETVYFTNPEYRVHWEEYDITDSDVLEYNDFTSEFEVVDLEALRSVGAYQGYHLILVVRRKEDSQHFGVSYYRSGGKYGEDYLTEAVDFDLDSFVMEPVTPSVIHTFKFEEK